MRKKRQGRVKEAHKYSVLGDKRDTQKEAPPFPWTGFGLYFTHQLAVALNVLH